MSSPNDLQKQASLKTSDAAIHAEPVVLDALVNPTRGILLGGSGNVAVVMASGKAITLPSLAAGVIHPFSVTKVNTTNTTATNIILVW